ncbi:uncharacterized protein V2V93DRAFT_363406 [Kockiozyma suomiensis]|uniref:uncharacterized protein n=1 Tax=Kockiozyma suomiensis TaxID=1337062 RepID=UPI003343B769
MQSPHGIKAKARPEKSKKPLTSHILFPEISKRFKENPSETASLHGLFIFSILRDSAIVDEWSILFPGGGTLPEVHHQAIPTGFAEKSKGRLSTVVIELDDRDLVKYITGGLTGLKGVTTGRIRIAGDIDLALRLEDAFVKTGGVQQTLSYLRARRGKL